MRLEGRCITGWQKWWEGYGGYDKDTDMNCLKNNKQNDQQKGHPQQ